MVERTAQELLLLASNDPVSALYIYIYVCTVVSTHIYIYMYVSLKNILYSRPPYGGAHRPGATVAGVNSRVNPVSALHIYTYTVSTHIYIYIYR